MRSELQDLVSIADLAREFPAMSASSIRDLVYHSTARMSARGDPIPPNGFAVCIVRIGKRVLIDRRAFAAWIEARRAAPPEPA
jgi:hypothetical protein